MAATDHAADEDIMILSFSKIAGLAGTRLRWAFFRDPELATRVNTNALTISHDAQARAFQILKAITMVYSIDNGPVPMGLSPARYAAQGRVFHVGLSISHGRYEWLQGILARSSRFSILEREPDYCAYFGQKLPPSPAYAWIYCNRDEDEDCNNLFLSSAISSYPGIQYGTTNRYVGFSLLKRDSDDEQLEKYLSVLVAG